MAAKKKRTYTLDERAAILAELANDTVATVAKKHHLSQNSLYNWKKAAGMNGGGKTSAKKKARKLGKKARRSASNGHATGSVTVATLDGVHAQLTTALESVTRMRDAFRTVFGGERE